MDSSLMTDQSTSTSNQANSFSSFDSFYEKNSDGNVENNKKKDDYETEESSRRERSASDIENESNIDQSSGFNSDTNDNSFKFLNETDLVSDYSDSCSDISEVEINNITKNIENYNQINSNSVTLTSIPLFILTWNVNARVEEEENLRNKIFGGKTGCFSSPPTTPSHVSTSQIKKSEEAIRLLNSDSVELEDSKTSNSPTFSDFNFNNNYNMNNLKEASDIDELKDKLENAFTSPDKSATNNNSFGNESNGIGRGLGISPEIIIIGVQEMVELTTTSVLESTVLGQQCQEKLTAWQTNILNVLKENNSDFELVTRHHMVGLAIFVFATSQWREQIKNIQLSSLPRGVGGVLGNKGAVYIRFDLLDSSVCLVNAHFAAHQDNVKKRNEDYFAIIKHIAFPDTLSARIAQLPSFTLEKYQKLSQAKNNLNLLHKKINDFKKNSVKFTEEMVNLNISNPSSNSNINNSNHSTLTQDSTANSPSLQVSNLPSTMTPIPISNSQGLSANDHDVIIWFGDLNYRIDAELEEVYYHIDQNTHIELLVHDQLRKQMEGVNSEGVFDNFFEPIIIFPPTYQYIPDVGEYDRRKDKKMRIPAWCDRILWRVGKKYSNQIVSKKVRKLQNKIDKLNQNLLSSQNNRERNKIEKKKQKKLEELNSIDQESRDRSDSFSSINSADQELDKINKNSYNQRRKDSVFTNTLTETIEVIQYTSFDNKISDHRPVCALLNLKVKKIDWVERENKFLSLYSDLIYDVDPKSYPLNIFRLPWISSDPHVLKIECHKHSKIPPNFVIDSNVEDNKIIFGNHDNNYSAFIAEYIYSPASIRVHNHSSAYYCYLNSETFSSRSNSWVKVGNKFSLVEKNLKKKIKEDYLSSDDHEDAELHIIPPRSYKDIPISVDLQFALEYYGEEELKKNPQTFLLDFDATWHDSSDTPLDSSNYVETLLIPVEIFF